MYDRKNKLVQQAESHGQQPDHEDIGHEHEQPDREQSNHEQPDGNNVQADEPVHDLEAGILPTGELAEDVRRDRDIMVQTPVTRSGKPTN